MCRVRGKSTTVTITVGTVNPDTQVDISVVGIDSSFSRCSMESSWTRRVHFSRSTGEATVLRVGGNLRFTHTVESDVNLTEGVVQMNGDGNFGVQTLEAGGMDLGAGGSTAGNFGIGQLIVGEEGLTSIVQVFDDVSNGNRGAGDELEALYLFGIGNEGEQNEQDGLRILNESRLVIEADVNVYALIDADMFGVTDGTRQWEHLNDWFGQLGVDTIEFDGGFISTIPEPTTFVILAIGGLAILRRRVA